MNPLRSVGARLSLALLLVVAGALGIVYVIVVPTIEKRLVNSKLAQLERAAPGLREQLRTTQYGPDFIYNDPDFVYNASASASARVVLLAPLSQAVPALRSIDDSGPNTGDVESDPIALAASLSQRPRHGTVTRANEQYAEAAVPVASDGTVLLLSAPLHGALDVVHTVQRRLVLAGLLALFVALLVGNGGARVFARRLRRLERAAERIASGDFEHPVVDTGPDEVGQLARAFERMRLRLAQLDHARSEFIANASHELRTPLFSLGGFLELLTDEELDEATRDEFLATMREQVERLTKLATELLDLSRLDAGRLRVEHETLDLARLSHVLTDEFAAVARAEDHRLEVAADTQVSAIGDEQRVLQIGRALVENALVHTPAGTRIVVRAAGEGERPTLVVEDDGPGVPSEHAGQVFQRFYRIDGTRASGSGLGLAIAHELAERMGGVLELESRPGRTAFTLALPPAALPAEPVPDEPGLVEV